MITVDIDELNNIPDELLLDLSGAVAGRYAAYLRIENTELKRQLAEREWQDCNTKLPELEQLVVVFYKAVWGRGYGIDSLTDDPQDGWYWSELGSSPTNDLVTHWMPLPPAPKQEKPE